MKKIISLILILVTLSLTLVGCSNPSFDTALRWIAEGEGETYVYDVTVAGRLAAVGDYNGDSNLITGTQYDQYSPTVATGTYTVNIKQHADNANYHVLTTTLEIYENYLIDNCGIEQDLIDQATNDGLATIPESNVVQLKTTVTSTCTFDSTKVAGGLRAISSSRTVKGFYIGKMRRVYNHYKVDCSYDYSGKKYLCNYTVADLVADTNNEGSIKFSSSSTAPVYDNNLMWLALRSYTPSQMTTGLSLNFIEPILFPDSTVPLTAKSTLDYKLALPDGRAGTFAVYAISGGTSMIMAVDTVDTASIKNAPRNTFIPVKIQQGYLTYILQGSYLDALNYIVPAEA